MSYEYLYYPLDVEGVTLKGQPRRNEKNSGGATNHEILLATMDGWPTKKIFHFKLSKKGIKS